MEVNNLTLYRLKPIRVAYYLFLTVIVTSAFLALLYSATIDKSHTPSHAFCRGNCGLADDVSQQHQQRQLALDSYRVGTVFPTEVFYVWCRPPNSIFEYRHYLSVRSVFEHLRPYRVTFYYENEPKASRYDYNSWFVELVDQFAFFGKQAMPSGQCDRLSSTGNNKIDEARLFENAGIYVREDVIFGPLIGVLLERLLSETQDIFTAECTSGHRLLRITKRRIHRGQLTITNVTKLAAGFDRKSPKFMFKRTNIGNRKIITVGYFSGENERKPDDSSVAIGVRKKALATGYHNDPILLISDSYVVPEDIWELNTPAGRLLRHAAYGSPDLAAPVPNYDTLAPNIAHVVWSNNDTMDFPFYLCVLSLIEVGKVNRVFIHGDGPPTGLYWDLIKDNPRLSIVRRTLIDNRSERIYGNEVKGIEHIADIWRADILFRYGGLYIDTDAILVQPLSRELRAYDAVLSKDVYPAKQFHAVYQNGVMIGKSRAAFWRRLLESMRIYLDNDWLWNSGYQPYRIKERYPRLLRDDPQLNTICNNGKCYPSWTGQSDFYVSAKNHLVTSSMKNWSTDAYVVHHTFPDLTELADYKALLKNNGTTLFGEIGLYVLKQANMLEYFRRRATVDSKI